MLLDEYLQGDLTPNRLPSTWVTRTQFVFQADDGGLAVLDTANNSVRTLVTNHTLVSRIDICSTSIPQCLRHICRYATYIYIYL